MKTRLLLATLAATSVASALAATEITLLDTSDVTWERTPEGVAFAPLSGDRFREAYQALVELPAGTVSPPHVKTATMNGVLLQGKMVHYGSASDPNAARVMGPGSFYSIPAGFAHVSACVSAVPCVAYLYQDGAFDFIPVQP